MGTPTHDLRLDMVCNVNMPQAGLCWCWWRTETLFRREAVGDVNMPQAGFCDKKLFLVENRNHVWRDLSRLGRLSHLLVVET